MPESIDLQLIVNGARHDAPDRAARDAGRRPARTARPDRHQGLLRRPGLWRLHRAGRRAGRQRLHLPGRGRRRAARSARSRGWPSTGDLSPLQQAFIDHAAFQCGFCTPGMLMAATALLEENPHPTREEVIARPRGQPLPLHGLRADHRCRAGRRRAAARNRETRRMRRVDNATACHRRRSAISVPRRDGVAKVTGAAPVHGGPRPPAWPTRESCAAPTPHARIRSIDTPPRARHPGVDGGGDRARTCRTSTSCYGHAAGRPPADRRAARSGYAGEPVVGVVAEDAVTARRGARASSRSTTSRCPFVTDRRGRPGGGRPDHPRAARRAAAASRLRGGHRARPPQRLLALAPALGRRRGCVRGRALVVEGEYRYPMSLRVRDGAVHRDRRAGTRAS